MLDTLYWHGTAKVGRASVGVRVGSSRQIKTAIVTARSNTIAAQLAAAEALNATLAANKPAVLAAVKPEVRAQLEAQMRAVERAAASSRLW